MKPKVTGLHNPMVYGVNATQWRVQTDEGIAFCETWFEAMAKAYPTSSTGFGWPVEEIGPSITVHRADGESDEEFARRRDREVSEFFASNPEPTTVYDWDPNYAFRWRPTCHPAKRWAKPIPWLMASDVPKGAVVPDEAIQDGNPNRAIAGEDLVAGEMAYHELDGLIYRWPEWQERRLLLRLPAGWLEALEVPDA